MASFILFSSLLLSAVIMATSAPTSSVAEPMAYWCQGYAPPISHPRSLQQISLATNVRAVAGPKKKPPTDPYFGTTEGPIPASKLVGRSLGFIAEASKEEVASVLMANLVFMEGQYDGTQMGREARSALQPPQTPSMPGSALRSSSCRAPRGLRSIRGRGRLESLSLVRIPPSCSSPECCCTDHGRKIGDA